MLKTVKMMQVYDMLALRGNNVLVTPNKDAIIVAPSNNNCYTLIGCTDDLRHYTVNLIRCTTSEVLKSDYLKTSTATIKAVEKLLKYSHLILECKKTTLKDANNFLYVSFVGDADEVLLSLMHDDGINTYAIKVLSCTLNNGIYESGYCKTDYMEYDSEYTLINEFIKGEIC